MYPPPLGAASFAHYISRLALVKKGISPEKKILYIVVVLRTTTIYTPYFSLAAPFSGQLDLGL
jgi:hypothetical protein